MPPSSCLAIAHRGASHYAPENTNAAFDLAVQMGAGDIELDVHLSADGHLVVIHDDTLDRTTDGSGPVAALPLAELRRLDAGSWFSPRFAAERIPVFDEVLARHAGRAHIHAEIKGRDADLSRLMVAEVRRAGAEERVTMTAFTLDRLEPVRRLAPGLPTGWLVKQVTDEVITAARNLGIAQICPRADRMDESLVRRLHGEGFSVRAWGISSEEDMRNVVRMGADGMTVNYPDRLLRFLAARSD